jgi:hypothetical protein
MSKTVATSIRLSQPRLIELGELSRKIGISRHAAIVGCALRGLELASSSATEREKMLKALSEETFSKTILERGGAR